MAFIKKSLYLTNLLTANHKIRIFVLISLILNSNIMTAQDIIRQTEKLSPDEQKSLISFLVLKYINPNEKQNLMQLFHYQNDFEEVKNKTEKQTNSGITNLLKYSGILEGINTSDISEEELYLQGD
ncbi:MAG: hypothetical protein U9N85_12290 [Bacteroidota bacterium]|nr:hypothetical protein [Bacteroidota bacterium]